MSRKKIKHPTPPQEEERLKLLESSNILEELSEKELDRIVRLAASICEVPISLVSIVDKDKQWFKAKKGLDVEGMAREGSFCQYAILENAFMEVENALEDERFRENPLVLGDPNIRFYAAVPLFITENHAMGSLCVISDEPKKLKEYQKEALKVLGDQVINTINLHIQNKEREKYEKFFNLSEDLFCLISSRGQFQEMNAAFCKKLNYSPTELQKMSFDELIYAEDLKTTKVALLELENGVETVSFVNRYKTQEGTFIWLEWIASKQEQNEFIYASARDISAQKQAEVQLIEKQNQYRSFVENIQGVFIIFNLDGTIIEANQNVEEILGYPLNQLVGQPVNILMANPESVEEMENSLKESIQNSRSVGTFRFVRQDGEERFLYMKNVLTQTAKGPKVIMSSGVDITDRIDMEQELKKAIYSEKIARVKEEFMANMSHEIRTPMNAIMGFSSILKNSKLDQQQGSFVEAISIASESLLEIVNKVLDFSAIDSGRLQLEKVSFNISEQMNTVHRLMLDRAEEKKIELNFFLDPNFPTHVIGDPVRFNQILINLIENAIKFTEVGEVEVLGNVIKQDKNKVSLKISVKDTGIGIPKAHQTYIFNEFQQGDNSLNRQHTGAGLGLSITKELLEAQGGDLSFWSRENKGSVFIATISYDLDSNPEKKNTLVALPSTLKGIKVLLVEDGQLNQVLAQKLLLDMNAEIHLAVNGKEAITMLEKQQYDIILMDLQMPIMDGYTTTKNIRNIMQLNTPIIAVTAHSLKGEREKCLKIGMNEYLSKPYKKEDLYRKINLFLS